MAMLCGMTAPTLISLALLPFPEVAGAAGALQGTLKMSIGGILLFWFAQYQVSTALELAYVMLAASGLVLIITLVLIKFLFTKETPITS